MLILHVLHFFIHNCHEMEDVQAYSCSQTFTYSLEKNTNFFSPSLAVKLRKLFLLQVS